MFSFGNDFPFQQFMQSNFKRICAFFQISMCILHTHSLKHRRRRQFSKEIWILPCWQRTERKRGFSRSDFRSCHENYPTKYHCISSSPLAPRTTSSFHLCEWKKATFSHKNLVYSHPSYDVSCRVKAFPWRIWVGTRGRRSKTFPMSLWSDSSSGQKVANSAPLSTRTRSLRKHRENSIRPLY